MRQIFTNLIFIFSLMLCSNNLEAQQTEGTAKKALEHFNNGDYERAIPLYKALLERYDRSPNYNYYFGVSLIEQHQNNEEAIQRLKFASLKNVNRDVFFYLGKAYQNAYEFEEAIKQFTRFMKNADKEDARQTTAQRAIDDCRSAAALINKYYQVTVLAKDTLPTEDILSKYHLSGEAGTLTRNRSFFKTGVDPEQIMYKTEMENEVLFVLEQPDTALYDIYKMVRLLDSWSKSKELGPPVNTEHDERYPFLLVDGTTFYFSSNRPGGMGGMDIYQSFFDPETNTYSPPENLGPPINSPADDYMFAADPFGNKAWFSTTRGVKPGETAVITLKWDKSVIKNLARDTEQIRQLAELPLQEKDSALLQGPQQETDRPQDRKTREDFRFHINDTLFYTLFEHFMSAEALNEFKKGFDMKNRKDSLELLMNRKREIYSQSYNKKELTELIGEILQLEQQVYNLTDQIQNHFMKARQLEMQKIEQMKKKGTYNAPQYNRKSTGTKLPGETAPPGYGLFYNNDREVQTEKLRAMYRHYFSPLDNTTLLKADSIYARANLLKLESARLLEKGREIENTENKLSLLEKIRNIDTLKGTEEPEANYVFEARATGKKALELYHEALDAKYRIYLPVVTEISQKSQNSHLKDSLGEIRAYYHEAVEGLEKMYTYNQERYEALGSLKREAVAKMESVLLNNSGTNSNHTASSQIKTTNAAAESSFAEKPNISGVNSQTSPAPSPAKVVAAAFQASKKPVYKIQIGVFSSKPSQKAIDIIPPVSTSQVEGKNLTRYYSGHWNTFREAQSYVEAIREAGFDGAFVVAFVNGEPISLDKAKAMSDD